MSEHTSVVWVLLTHFSGALDATDTASVSMELCGLETSSTRTTPHTPRTMPVADNNTLIATTWIVSDAHNTYWAAWTRDVAQAMADSNLTWPAGVSRYDETAPASLLRRKGWERVNSQWSKYRTMAQLSPNASDVAVRVSARGCATLEVEMEPHAVVLFEMRRPNLES